MKKILFILALMILLPSVLAISINVEKQSSNEVMIVDVGEPAIINLKVTNTGPADKFLFYTFFGQGIEPSNRIDINQGEIKNIQLKVSPRQDSDLRGFSTFEYFIQSMDKSQTTEKLTINLIDLKDAFEIGSEDINPESKTIKVYVTNKAGIDFKDLKVDFNSAFFKLDQTFSLGPDEKKVFEINLDKDDFSKLVAGFYTLETQIKYKEVTADLESQIRFTEKDLLRSTNDDYGFIIKTQVVEKTNQGNKVTSSTTTIKKNIISRLFTTFNPEPSNVERQGFDVYYTWDSQVNPGETAKIKVKTNWVLPLIILILIVSILIIIKKYSEKDLVLRKRISFVNAKGGEFALKVTIAVKARKYLEKVNVIDRLPPLVKIYEKFLNEEPSRVDEHKKRIEWGFEKLEEGERRILSYIIYSKVGVLGKFALPSTTAIYEREGKIRETNSNKAYFVAEQFKSQKMDD